MLKSASPAAPPAVTLPLFLPQAPPDKVSGLIHAAALLVQLLGQGRALDSRALRSAMEAAFGGTDAEGTWVWNDAYEALEAAQVLFLRKFGSAMRTRAGPQLPTPIAPAERLLTAAEFHRLAEVPAEIEWFANIRNRSTRRAYENAIRDFMQFTGIFPPEEFRTVTRAHVIAWRDDLARRQLGGATIRHRHAALSSLFEYLCEKNAVTHNPCQRG